MAKRDPRAKTWVSTGVINKSGKLQAKCFGCFRTQREAREAAIAAGCVVHHQTRHYWWTDSYGNHIVAFTYVIGMFYGDIKVRLEMTGEKPSKTQAHKELDIKLKRQPDRCLVLPRQIVQLQEG